MANGFRLGRRHAALEERKYPPRRPTTQFVAHAPDAERDRLLERLARVDREVRRECFGLPIDADPIYPIVRELFPGGARLEDVARAYGVSKERVRQLGDAGIGRLRGRLDGHAIERGPSVWDELEAAS